MKSRKIIIRVASIMLIISLGNFFRIISDHNIRAVDFVSIFSIGIIAGVLISHLIGTKKED